MSWRERESDEPEVVSHGVDITTTTTSTSTSASTSSSSTASILSASNVQSTVLSAHPARLSQPLLSPSSWSAPATGLTAAPSASASARQSPSLPSISSEASGSQSIFSPRLSPQHHHTPHQQQPAPELDLASPRQIPSTTQSTQPSSSLFNNPNRSIFSSGPPTASVSANTAHASMSSPSPVRSGRPLSVLNAPSSSNGKRAVHYGLDGPSTPRKARISRAEKDIDDPSASVDQGGTDDRRGTSTPTALSRLFAAAPDATPIVSRHSSYIRTASGTAYTRASNTDTAPLPNHLYHQGLLKGKHSDITVHAFNTRYPLHRILLDRAPFFSSALSEPWFESSAKEITLHPEDIDSHISQAAFELALKRLYGCPVAAEEDGEAIGLFATGCWLEMPDLIDASVASILRQMTTARLGSLIGLVTTNYYGKHGERILASAKAMLCREGWEMPLRFWDGVSGEIAREIIGGDGFFVPGEWERFIVAKRVFDRKLKVRAIEAGLMEVNGSCKRGPPDTMRFSAIRFDQVYRKNASYGTRPIPEVYDPWLALYTSPDIAALLVLLDEGIHYVHLNFEQLQKIREQRDVLGLPLLPAKVINDALWMQIELRQRVVNAPELDLELGLSQPSEDIHDGENVESDDLSGMTSHESKQKDAEGLEDDESEFDSGSWDGNGKPRKFWIPNLDSTSVMGGHPETALYAAASSHRPYVSRLSASIDPVDVQWASDFTASANDRPTTADRTEPLPPISYTHYPPFRFAAEFPNPRNLKEKKRVYSRTVWYAGSLWNVYIQKVETTKNTQLGVYLHRAKEKEGHDEHHISSVDERIGQVEMLMRRNYNHRRRQSRGEILDEDTSASGTDSDLTLVPPDQSSRATTISNLLRGGGVVGGSSNNSSSNSHDNHPVTKSSQSPGRSSLPDHLASNHASGGSGGGGGDLDDLDTYNEDLLLLQHRESSKTHRFVPTLPAYVDGRPTIKTYFKIYSPSKGGRMLSVYESAPDLFNFSQSWGWKSSTMVLDDAAYGYDGGSADGAAAAAAAAARAGNSGGGGASGVTGNAREGRLRFMVVIGNV